MDKLRLFLIQIPVPAVLLLANIAVLLAIQAARLAG